MNMLLWIFITLVFSKLFTELFLDVCNKRHILKNSHAVPDYYKTLIDKETYVKSVQYSLAKNQFAFRKSIFDAVLIIALIFSGILPFIYNSLTAFLGTSNWAQAFILIATLVIAFLPVLPWDAWYQFKIEQAFDFNKTTPQLWITDKLKTLLLTFILGTPLLAFIFFLIKLFPKHWWLYGALSVIIFQLLLMIIYPRVILPLFNRLTPLAEGSLKQKLLATADKANFHASTIHVIDGSKRSTHSNAFFTGFGKFRRIVLFDTLMQQLEPEEIEAVLVHEIGHYKKGHIPKRLLLSSLTLFIFFGALAWLTEQHWIFEKMGFISSDAIAPAIILFFIFMDLFSFWFSPLSNYWSRKHEYEADHFAKQLLHSPDAMISSIRKLHTKNLSNLTPHPLFSCFYYSHPILQDREEALKQK